MKAFTNASSRLNNKFWSEKIRFYFLKQHQIKINKRKKQKKFLIDLNRE